MWKRFLDWDIIKNIDQMKLNKCADVDQNNLKVTLKKSNLSLKWEPCLLEKLSFLVAIIV